MTTCAWCDSVIDPKNPEFKSHGICLECYKEINDVIDSFEDKKEAA